MKAVKLPIYISILAIFAFTSCSTNSNNRSERTFPQALNYQSVSFQNFEDTVVPPDSVNIDVYVNEIIECPPGNFCILADAILISDSLQTVSPASQYRLRVRHPGQFEKGERYIISLKIGTYPGNGQKKVALRGYSILK